MSLGFFAAIVAGSLLAGCDFARGKRARRAKGGEELIDQLGWLRLGLALEVLPPAAAGLDWDVLDRILLRGQPAHLQLCHPDVDLDRPEVRDEYRATLVRRWLSGRSE